MEEDFHSLPTAGSIIPHQSKTMRNLLFRMARHAATMANGVSQCECAQSLIYYVDDMALQQFDMETNQKSGTFAVFSSLFLIFPLIK